MGRLRACRHHLRRLLEARPPPSSPTPARLPHLPARVSPFSSAVAVAATVPHDTRDSGLGSSAYWAWIRAAAESAPAPAPPQEEEEEGPARYIPVKAYFLSTSIDLKSLQAEHGTDVVPPSTRSLNYIALRYSEFPPEIMDIGVKDSRFCYRYVVVFQYGSAVLFNIADHEAEHYLEMIRNHASGWLPEMRKDDYAVVEKPSLTTWMKGGLDYIVLKSLDTDGIRIISSVLGQSIALDHYIRQVDDMVEEFTEINRTMEKTGDFTMKRKKLFQLVGKANSNLADVIIRLGLFDRSEIAWKNANYAQILEYLREEYELNQRFGSLDFKLKFVERNVCEDKAANILTTWDGQNNTTIGRTTLFRYVITSQTVFAITPLIVPASILKNLNKLERAFLWPGSNKTTEAKCKVNRDLVCRLKDYGGLGVFNTDKFARALRLR